jgi:hypothetical protein
MTHAREMLNAHPGTAAIDADALIECIQRVAMRMVCMASWTDESLFQRPPSENRGRHRARDVQGPGRSHLRGRHLDAQALRYQGPKGRASGAGQGSGQTAQDRRADQQAPRGGSPRERPFVSLKERCEYVEAVSGVSVSRSTMCRAIARIGCTRKKGGEVPRSETSS